MTATPTLNAEAAAANTRDDFGLIFTTTRPIQENRTNDLIPARRAFFKPSR